MSFNSVYNNGGIIGPTLSYTDITKYTTTESGYASIQYVGGATQTAAGGTANITVTLNALTGGIATAPAANDIVIIAISIGATTSKTYRITGYTQIASLYANDTYDANLQVGWKLMPSTPDTTATITGGSGATADSMTIAVQVWRNVDTTTPIGSTPTGASILNTAIPAFNALSPTTSGSVIICTAGAGHIGAAATYTASTLYNFLTVGLNGTVDSTVGMGVAGVWNSADGVSYGAASWTFSVADATTYSCCTSAFALRPATTTITQPRNNKNSGIWNLQTALESGAPVSPIIDSSLQIYLDGGDPVSYPGTGTTWTNIVNQSYNATFTTTPTTTTDKGGGIVFDSTLSATLGSGATTTSNSFTSSVWIKHTGLVNVQKVQRYLTIATATDGFVLRHGTGYAQGLHGYVFDSTATFRSIEVANQLDTGSYYNIVLRYNGTVMTLWKNNAIIGTLTATFTLPSITSVLISAAGEWFNGNMYIVQYYNRALSDTEIGTNYNAYKNRFGL